MGFWQDLTGDTAGDAQGAARDQLKQDRDNALRYLDVYGERASKDISSGYGSARGAITGGYNNAINYLQPGFDQARSDISTGSGNALNYLGQGRDAAVGAYTPLSNLGTKYGGATTMALNALGVNGQGGIDAARSAFQTSPGYDFNLTQGLDAINRARAASGQLASGNTDRANQDYGAGLASKEYNTWLNNLIGFTNPELSATSGAASGVAAANNNYGTNAANVANRTGESLASISQNRAKMLGDLASQYGTNLGNLYSTEGNNLANIDQARGTGGANVYTQFSQPIAGTITAEGAARGAGAANIANLGLSLANLGAGTLGGFNFGSPLSLNAGNFGGTGGGLGGFY